MNGGNAAPVLPNEQIDNQRSSITALHWVIGIALLLLRVPYILIHHIQEDAFITLRTARHLAENGQLSYNLGQHFPATTSLLYPVGLAVLDRLFGEHALLWAQLLGSAAVIAGSFFAVRVVARTEAERVALWVLLASWPVSLIVSYTGMETPFLLLAMGLAIDGMQARAPRWQFPSAIALMLLIRPDAIAYALVFCAAMLLLARRRGLVGLGAMAASLAVVALGYKWVSGSYLPTTMRAKLQAYHPSHAPGAMMARVYELFLHHSYLLPVSTTYLDRLSPLFLAAFVLCLLIAVRRAASVQERVIVGAVALLAVAVPLAYAWGGVLFDWYLYPANWLAVIVLLAGAARLVECIGRPRTVLAFAALAWIAFAGVQWARSLAASTQDYHYRGDIGRYLHGVARPGDTLFLEPAGYIPYYSGLVTADEVGLVSRDVSSFIARHPGHWWIDYVEARQPDWIVERQSFAHFETFDGQQLSPPEQQWFTEHYKLVRRTHYEPSVYHASPLLRPILRMGPMPDYLIYHRRQ